jgi:hypothetical protein
MRKASTFGRVRARDVAGSIAGFLVVLVTLVALDKRVGERFTQAFTGSPTDQVSTLASRLQALGDAVIVALKDQSIDHAPMLVFTAVGVLLVLFMVRT